MATPLASIARMIARTSEPAMGVAQRVLGAVLRDYRKGCRRTGRTEARGRSYEKQLTW